MCERSTTPKYFEEKNNEEEEEEEEEEGWERRRTIRGGVEVTGFPLFQKMASVVVVILLRSITKASWVLNDSPTVSCVTGALGSGWPQSSKKKTCLKVGVAV